MSHSSQKSAVHNLQTAEDQQQTTEEDHQHLVLKKIDVPKIHEPQVSISAKKKIAPSKHPPPAAAPLVAHLEPRSPQDEQPSPTMVEPSFKPIPQQDYSPSSPASHAGAYPYPHFPQDEISPVSSFTLNRSRVQSPLGSPVHHMQGLPPVPATVSPNASNLPEDYPQPKKILPPKRSESPSSRPCCGCIIL
ncbi:hypothetical protein J1N35_036558 [Gossypium stocksii]|uniref:Uncharacterized protein n=1 Tax=Gossypium stocksii TaxID=47602 RepID=A0A9D3UJ54_9ROSI|nr:hypothetical protein J1N35_036558 [Gossypium stocksii]